MVMYIDDGATDDERRGMVQEAKDLQQQERLRVQLGYLGALDDGGVLGLTDEGGYGQGERRDGAAREHVTVREQLVRRRRAADVHACRMGDCARALAMHWSLALALAAGGIRQAVYARAEQRKANGH